MLEPSELFPEVANLYEFLSVHAGMVYDEERVSRYGEAIQSVVKPGTTVVDIGTGTGLLAFMCLQKGASHVYAIERSAAIRWAKLLAKHHGLADKITFYSGDSRDVQLPEKSDVVISELIGHIAYEEGMAESLFDAKSRFLRPNGAIVPRTVSLVAVPVYETEMYETCINCWRDVWGIDYSLLRQDALRTCYIKEFSDENLMAVPATIFTLDFIEGQQPSELRGSSTFTISRAGEVNGIAMWFDAELTPGVKLSSGPWNRTHWQQSFAPVETPLSVQKGDHVCIEVMMRLRGQSNDAFQFTFGMRTESKEA